MVEKAIVGLPIDAGVYTEQTERGARGRWYRADKVRFRKGLPEKLGGWVQKAPQFIGTCRRLHDWTSLDGKFWTAIATEAKLYLWQDETLYNITPLRASGSLTDPFTTTMGSATVTIAHTAHGGQVGDYVIFDDATAVGGITIDGEYTIVTVPDADSYTITHTSNASSGATGGGTVTYQYEISVGSSTAVAATGYGTGPYGREGYGNARTASTSIIATRTWALDNWGEDLIASYRGGSIYYWDRTTGSSARAVLLSGAPGVNRYVIISQRDRHVFSLGAYDDVNGRDDPLLVRWNTNEDLADWLPSADNTAGDIRIFRGSKIVGGIRTRLETLVFTDISVHSLIGQGSGIFGQNVIGENVSIMGPNAAVAIDHRVLFMADADFYIYDGILRVLPCDVRNYVFDNLVVAQKDKVYAGTNKMFNEVWWFYPSRDPDAWVQQDFSLGLPSGYQIAQPSSGGTAGYSYTFNSSGYTIPVGTAANGYEHDYVLTNDEPILTPLEAEYAVELDISPDYNNGPKLAGLCFLRSDITGTIDTNADDVKQWMVELDYDNDNIQIRVKNPDGTITAPDNLSGTNTSDVSDLTGTALTTGVKYVIKVAVDTPNIKVYLDDVEAFDFNMSSTELTDFTGGSAGLHVAANADSDSSYRFYNFAVSPLAVITDANFDISPIEVNRYVAFNYEEGTWTMGTLARTAWADKSPVLDKPYGTGTDSYVYQHETGVDDNGSAMAVSLKSYDMEIGEGELLMHIDQLIPDFLKLEGSVDVTLSGKKYPGDQTRITKGPYTVSPGTRKVSTRMRARQVALEISSDAMGDNWRMGQWRGRAGPHGKR